jgi:hypothetical protein
MGFAVTRAPVADPLSYSRPLPLVATFYPFGFGVEVSTDSEEVLEAASGIWSGYPKLFDPPPVRLRVAVSPYNSEIPPTPSIPRGQENLVTFIHGPENFAVADLARGFSFACLTGDVAHDRPYLVHHFLEPLTYVLLAARHVTILHAACVALEGRAVLLAGESGSGKTCLSYACAKRGWTFLSGDATQFATAAPNGTVLGRPFSIRFRGGARDLFPELGRYSAERRYNGKVDIEPPVKDLEISTAVQAKATQIVFLARSPHERQAILSTVTTLSPVTRDEAFRRLEQAIFFGDEQFRTEHRAALTLFIESRPAFELSYSDLAQAERVLRLLVTGNKPLL